MVLLVVTELVTVSDMLVVAEEVREAVAVVVCVVVIVEDAVVVADVASQPRKFPIACALVAALRALTTKSQVFLAFTCPKTLHATVYG